MFNVYEWICVNEWQFEESVGSGNSKNQVALLHTGWTLYVKVFVLEQKGAGGLRKKPLEFAQLESIIHSLSYLQTLTLSF